MTNRLAPLEPPFSTDVADLLSRYPSQDGYLLSLFRTFANSSRFLAKGVPNLLDRDSPLTLREREIVILRVSANFGCEYEWGIHVAIFARAARLTEAEIAATHPGTKDHAVWKPRERRLIAAVDAFCRHGMLENSAVDAFADDWTKAQQLEIAALCGAYHTISVVAHLASLPPEPFAASFPAP